MKKLTYLLIGGLLTFTLVKCSSTKKTTSSAEATKFDANKLYIPSAKNASSDYPLADLEKGYSLYNSNCGSCHKLHLPQKHDESGWKETVKRMQPKAKISDADAELIFKYLIAYK